MAFNWKSLVRAVAPAIGTALGGPLAGMAVQSVSNAVLGKPNGTEDEISNALAGAGPEMLLTLKKEDNDFKVRMRELDIDVERLDYEDVKNARAREVALKDKMPAALAILLVVLFATVLAGLFFRPIPEANQSTIYTLIGSLGTLVVAACSYYHGSSRGSDKKTAAMIDIQTKRQN